MDVRRSHWIDLAVYWVIVFSFIHSATPVFADVGGLMPSYFSDGLPTPKMSEYYRHQLYYDAIYATPALITGLVFCLIAFGVTPAVEGFRQQSRAGFWRSATVTFVLILLSMLICDCGSKLDLWMSQLFLLNAVNWVQPDYPLALTKFVLPPSILSGLRHYG